MDIFSSFINAFSRLAGVPTAILSVLLTNYILIIFCGGLIFFIANTPPEAIFRVFDAFMAGDFAGAIDAIVDAAIIFAQNVRDNFDPATLSAALIRSICKIKAFAGFGSC